ncbi:alpha/beta hydrolase [Pararhodobacter sp.]|uniref:alpha/beta fold hydrolase n=1 Tax=Pararhodobacter sp. TaxID=2127056 RepID=UPI002AFF66C2|nr:alpha/beta hydrolase [Pararhodobacter sp.]
MNLLLIPGINNTAQTFAPMIAAMPSHIDCFPVDCAALPNVDDIARAILADAPARFVVGGHSFGGYVALAILALAPERVAGVILINTGTGSDTPTAAAAREERALRAEAGEYAALADAASARAYHPDNLGREDLMAERAAALLGYGAERYAAHSRASAIRPDRTELLKNSGVPVLVVSADKDVVIPTERQRDMAQNLGAENVVIAQAGHMLPAERPVLLANAVSEWLDRVKP